MSLFDRLLGGSRNKAYAEGMALLEEGRFADAIDHLRIAAEGRTDAPAGSLAGYHFRQALVNEGRRLMRAGRHTQAAAPFAEAVGLWDTYPDLHCLLGAAQGYSGRWTESLAQARTALRLNPDFIQARLLESVALGELDRKRESADSLNTLVESGRRVNHWLVDHLQESGPYDEDTLPADLSDLLLRVLSGRSEKEEVAEAVTMCRSGDWERGLEKFSALVAKRPRYPDYRTRLAAALFQVNRTDQALAEVEAALGLNDSYLAAIDLKGLILADSGRLFEAREFLAEKDAALGPRRNSQAHEDLFASYLRAALALLTGDPEEVPEILQGWPGLIRTFARAELLLAASEDLRDKPEACTRRLAELAGEWSAEPLYRFLLAGHYLRLQKYSEVPSVIGSWPAGDQPDLRPRFLNCCLSVCQGVVPDLPGSPGERGDAEAADVPPEAWSFLEARVAFLEGRDAESAALCRTLREAGFHSERILRLQLTAEASGSPGDEDEMINTVLPDSCLPAQVVSLLRRSRGHEVADLVRGQTAAHPENLWGYWLSPKFWFDPVRSWIA